MTMASKKAMASKKRKSREEAEEDECDGIEICFLVSQNSSFVATTEMILDAAMAKCTLSEVVDFSLSNLSKFPVNYVQILFSSVAYVFIKLLVFSFSCM